MLTKAIFENFWKEEVVCKVGLSGNGLLIMQKAGGIITIIGFTPQNKTGQRK